MNVLRIEDLTVRYPNRQGGLVAVNEAGMRIEAGQVYGLVGESGSGKSTLAMSAIRYLPRVAEIVGGSVEFLGADLYALDQPSLSAAWSRDMGLVPQDPSAALNPTLTVGRQVEEAADGSRQRAIELLGRVRISDPERVAASYPYQLSGGTQQRVLFAIALAGEPKLLVLDEPTTGLDSTTEATLLDLLRDLVGETDAAVLYVSHSLGVIAQFAERVAVMYSSEIVEDADTVSLFSRPLHPYSWGLLDSVPRLGENRHQIRLRAIEGDVPSLAHRAQGCLFAPRCPLAVEACWEERPALELVASSRAVRCHRWREIEAGELDPRQPPDTTVIQPGTGIDPLLGVDDLEVRYPARSGPVGRGAVEEVHAVNGVDLVVRHGETLGLVGESGSGKSSLARAVVGLVEPRAGRIELEGEVLPLRLDGRGRRSLKAIQMMFQNPDEALNPHLTVGTSLSRPLVRLLGMSPPDTESRVQELLRAVRLPPEAAGRLPAELSGGEKQRVALARAFAAVPDLVLLDEPVSSLDVSVQASILNLLNEMQAEHHTGMLFISHDLAVVGYLADRVGVMYLGSLMEEARAAELFEPPYHPYTEALLSAIPLIDPNATQERIRLEGELPSAVELPAGCPFHTRCPRVLGEVCETETPPWREGGDGKRIFCHIPVEDLEAKQVPAFHIEARE